jgi:hypothetical protein
MNRKLIAIVVFVCALPLLACGASGAFNVRVDDQYSYLTITMTEEQIAGMIVPLLENGEDFRVENPEIDLRPGEIVVTGSVVGDGGQLHPGSLALRAWAANGQLYLEVTRFSFAGFTATQSMLANFNAEMEAGLARDAENADSETHEVVITDTEFSITWRSPREE